MRIEISTAPIAPGSLLDAFCVGRRETGAIATFTGLVRADRGVTERLELESYIRLA